jgi:hypothetical protein
MSFRVGEVVGEAPVWCVDERGFAGGMFGSPAGEFPGRVDASSRGFHHKPHETAALQVGHQRQCYTASLELLHPLVRHAD